MSASEDYTEDKIDLALSHLRQIAQHPDNVPGLYRRYLMLAIERLRGEIALLRAQLAEKDEEIEMLGRYAKEWEWK